MEMFLAQRREPVVGILLAAGQGTRFDPGGLLNKLLARLPDGCTVLRAAAGNLCAVLDRVIVVMADDADRVKGLHAALNGLALEFVTNNKAGAGMSSSITAGVAASMETNAPDRPAGWIVALGDMPFVRPQTIAGLRRALMDGADIVAPSFAGQRGHPVGFSARHGSALQSLTGDQGARELLKRYPVQLIETGDSGILKDIDSPDDLATLLDAPA